MRFKELWNDWAINSLIRVQGDVERLTLTLEGANITNSCVTFLMFHLRHSLKALSLRRCHLTSRVMEEFEYCSLKELDITHCNLHVRVLPWQLTSLKCHGNTLALERGGALPSQLEELEADGLDGSAVHHLVRLVSLSLRGPTKGLNLTHFPALRTLRLDGANSTPEMLGTVPHELRSLHLAPEAARLGPLLAIIQERCPQLEELSLVVASRAANLELLACAPALQSLRRLAVVAGPGAAELLSALARSCPLLEQVQWLTSAGCGEMPVPQPRLPAFLCEAARFGLRTFNYTAPSQNDLDAVLAALCPCRQLEHLRLAGGLFCTISEPQARALTAGTPALEVFGTDNVSVSPIGLCAACSGWPRLRVLILQSGSPADPLDLAAVGAALPRLETLALWRSCVRIPVLMAFLQTARRLRVLHLQECCSPAANPGAPPPLAPPGAGPGFAPESCAGLVTDDVLEVLRGSWLRSLSLVDVFRPPGDNAECLVTQPSEQAFAELVARFRFLVQLAIHGAPAFGDVALRCLRERILGEDGHCSLRGVSLARNGLSSPWMAANLLDGVPVSILSKKPPSLAELWLHAVQPPERALRNPLSRSGYC
ncbi:hypothetical protein PAPYR_7003 [Paratrimastix pyriformis]|uniref:Uncharacterized protein n=1 Tax=Paratrimastix pyriformis TaxID=342808 RepID=A0ABQ8UE55_9EUKA|nr:hypothetical protein PAPYR_7003 [Paratrimastix pyriformis]